LPGTHRPAPSASSDADADADAGASELALGDILFEMFAHLALKRSLTCEGDKVVEVEDEQVSTPALDSFESSIVSAVAARAATDGRSGSEDKDVDHDNFDAAASSDAAARADSLRVSE
jgi:hypothetical protein